MSPRPAPTISTIHLTGARLYFFHFFNPFCCILTTSCSRRDPRKKSRAEHAAGVSSKKDKWKAHPLRERAKKLATEGVLTVRFEMPYNIRCIGCGNHIAKGVRFNAEKKTIGHYLSTKILSFRMPCHCEDGTSRTDQRRNPHWIEIHTDPKNAEYVVADGAVRVSDPRRDPQPCHMPARLSFCVALRKIGFQNGASPLAPADAD